MSGSLGVSQSKSSSKPVDITPSEYRAMRPYVASQLTSLLGGGPTYSGPFAAPITAQEQAGVDRVGYLTGGTRPLTGLASGEVEKTLRGDYLMPGSNPFLRATVDAATRPISEARDQQFLQDRSTYARAGHDLAASSPFATANALAERGYYNAVADTSANLYGQNYQDERGRQVGAAGQALEIDKAELDRTIEGLKASALPRLIEQYGIDAGQREFARRVEVALNAMGIASGLSSQFGNKSKSNSWSIQTSGGVGPPPDPTTPPAPVVS